MSDRNRERSLKFFRSSTYNKNGLEKVGRENTEIQCADLDFGIFLDSC